MKYFLSNRKVQNKAKAKDPSKKPWRFWYSQQVLKSSHSAAWYKESERLDFMNLTKTDSTTCLATVYRFLLEIEPNLTMKLCNASKMCKVPASLPEIIWTQALLQVSHGPSTCGVIRTASTREPDFVFAVTWAISYYYIAWHLCSSSNKFHQTSKRRNSNLFQENWEEHTANVRTGVWNDQNNSGINGYREVIRQASVQTTNKLRTLK